MITLCDICNNKCFSEVKKNCLTKNWMDFEPEAEYLCNICRAWKGGQCRVADGIQCLNLTTIIYMLVIVNVHIYKMVEDEVIPRMRGGITQLVEYRPDKAEAEGSSPSIPIKGA